MITAPTALRMRRIAEDVRALHRLGLELANSRAWPNYRATSEFRPIRDAPASARQ